MTQWLDQFTGQVYQVSEPQSKAVREGVALSLAQRLSAGNIHEKANAVAEYWHAYYERVFPLRFGRQRLKSGFTVGEELKYASSQDALSFPDGARWRESFLDEMNFPPVLPAETQPLGAELPVLLAPDHHLIIAALLNICLRRMGVDEDLVNQARLGALLHELIDLVPIRNLLEPYPVAFALAQYLKGESSSCPEALNRYRDLIDAVHTGDAVQLQNGYSLAIVGLAAQRIKQYVFETPGLAEIRGASALLDKVVLDAAEAISKTLGRECVLQQVASTLIFLAPEAGDRAEHLKRQFYETTLSAFCAAAAVEIPLNQLLSRYPETMREFLKAMDADRYRAEQAIWECLPFEARCAFCRKRPANALAKVAGGSALICSPCERKREAGGYEQRTEAGLRLLTDAGLIPQQIGVRDPKKAFAGTLDELVPETGEAEPKKQVAFIYGDGSNFGQITKNLTSLALSLQWTRRAELTTRAAVALALSRSMAYALQKVQLQRLPCEVLVIGGDDFSLFTWSRIALRFCEQFVRLTDTEFKKGDPKRCIVGETPICFGVGCLISDEKAPAYRVVEFTESQLLKFAKRGVPEHKQGTIAFLYTTNADQIPGDYERHLATNYKRKAYLDKDRADASPVYLTLQPLTAQELEHYLNCAEEIMQNDLLGSLQRLAEPFVRQPVMAALLHYVYQNARLEKNQEANTLFTSLQQLGWFPIRKSKRITIDSKSAQEHFFAPILDILEITKSLRSDLGK